MSEGIDVDEGHLSNNYAMNCRTAESINFLRVTIFPRSILSDGYFFCLSLFFLYAKKSLVFRGAVFTKALPRRPELPKISTLFFALECFIL